jgi:hypothetical protein
MSSRKAILLVAVSFALFQCHAAEVVRVQKIWDKAPHNAFTGLIWFSNQWMCVFREGKSHVSPEGSIRVLQSENGRDWSSKALIQKEGADLRDPKIVLTPRHELMIYAAAAFPAPAAVKHQSMAWFSKDGKDWGEPDEIGDANVWVWRVAWNKTNAYAVGYDTSAEEFTRLYKSDDGRRFNSIVPRLFDKGNPNESGLVFLQDGSLACLLRRDGPNANGLFGVAKPPFVEWNWKDTGKKIGGPDLLQLPNGRLIGAVRLYDGGARTSVVEIDGNSGALTELVKLPSGGDCSYPGLVWKENRLWMSYYSSHEGKTAIYFAEVKLD